jgi:MYXO-CTERM domain-containing protein
VAFADAAEIFARTFLERHLELLAPGALPGDFELASNVVHGGQRVVAFVQKAAGLRVLGGQLSFRFKNDRLFVIASQALPNVHVTPRPLTLSEADLQMEAEHWIGMDYGADALASDVTGPFVLPIVRDGYVADYRIVMRVTVDTRAMVSRWAVFLDADSGVPVAREQLLRFATGTVMYNVPVRRPTDVRADYPARSATLLVDAVSATTDDNGVLTFADGAPVQVASALAGPLVSVNNDAGPNASTMFTLDPGGTIVWNAANEPEIDAQLTSFIHARIAKDHGLGLAPDLSGFIDNLLPVNVNISDLCNAFYDGQAINFFQEGGPCENTGRLADVVYHEFGHWFHHHSLVFGSGEFDSALSEGLSDYYSANITGDPGMGRGFFFSNAPLRHIDPMTVEYKWPDDIDGDPHQTGLIIAGAFWDLRKLLVAEYGETEGVALTNDLYALGMRNAVDIPSMYPEVLAVDDDDGNLENGTPHACQIAEAFGTHGLRSLAIDHSTLSVEPPNQDGHRVTVRINGLFEGCDGDSVESAEIQWHLRRTPNEESVVTMTGSASELSGAIPTQAEGEVVRFRVEVKLSNGTSLTFPDNAADPNYEFYVGEVTPIYCTDFETDPALDGWTHGLLAGEQEEGADDWQWGEPFGTAQNGDPAEAFSGTHVFGNDLGAGNYNGLYKSEKVNYGDTPAIDVSGHAIVRVQYRRWLNVEDGFFDKARIYANEKPAWSNFASTNESGATHHRDREWRFQDLDLTPFVADDGMLKVRFEIRSDSGLNMGGWTLDDFCIVGTDAPFTEPTCGNATIEIGEDCDDGNATDGDGCSATCTTEQNAIDPIDEPLVTGGCGCRVTTTDDTTPRWLWALSLLGLVLARRRRR